jgi:hypothetical protein
VFVYSEIKNCVNSHVFRSKITFFLKRDNGVAFCALSFCN